MNNYQKIATIAVRSMALLFLLNAAIDIGLIVLDFALVKSGILNHSEIAFQPRVNYAALDVIVALFLCYQSQPAINFIINGLYAEDIDEETNMTKPDSTEGLAGEKTTQPLD